MLIKNEKPNICDTGGKWVNTKHHLYMFCAILPRNAKRQYLVSLHVYICLIYKKADTVFWLCRAAQSSAYWWILALFDCAVGDDAHIILILWLILLLVPMFYHHIFISFQPILMVYTLLRPVVAFPENGYLSFAVLIFLHCDKVSAHFIIRSNV